VERRAAFALLAGTIVAVLFAAVATAGEVKFADRAPSFPGGPTIDPPDTTIKPVRHVDVDETERARLQLPHVVDVALRVVFYACIAVVAALFLLYAWRHRPRMRWQLGRRRRSAQFEVLDDMAAVIGADADAQHAALRRGSPRNAIVECWLRLEKAVVAAGVRQDPADTSSEFTVRVLTTLHVDEVAIERLAALYREARFSDHPMGEDARRAAIDALDDIHDGLRARHGTAVATA
jgi:Domain of unknown function (DUF4129)